MPKSSKKTSKRSKCNLDTLDKVGHTKINTKIDTNIAGGRAKCLCQSSRFVRTGVEQKANIFDGRSLSAMVSVEPWQLMNSDTVQGRRTANCRQQQRHGSQSWSATEMSARHNTPAAAAAANRIPTIGRHVRITERAESRVILPISWFSHGASRLCVGLSTSKSISRFCYIVV